eukprot:jgi/Chlat1/5515/Chrsp360S05332
MMSACAMLPAAVFGNRPSPPGSARFSPQAGGGVPDHRACCVRGGVASSALASSRLQHRQRQSELKHLRHAIVPSAATIPRSPTVVRATAAPGGDSSSAKTSAGASKPGDLFDREYELDQLEALCSVYPQGISVIYGPRNCGKTKVLKAFVQRRDLEGTRSYIDCRETLMSTPAEMADALLNLPLPALGLQLPKKALSLLAKLPNIPWVVRLLFLALAVTPTIEGFTFAARSAGFVDTYDKVRRDEAEKVSAPQITREPASLKSVLAAYSALLDEWERARREGEIKAKGYPLLVIDEANVIMDWSDDYLTDLKALVRFLIRNTKQEGRAHVILVTSDSAFISWLTQNVGVEFYQTYAIGEFTEGEARGFISGQLQSLGTTAPSDAEWSLIYNACGGNAGVLRNAAASYVQFGSWQEAVERVLRDIRSEVQRGYAPLSGAGFERKHFETTVAAILNSTYMAVNADQLEPDVPPDALNALIAANLLSIRCSPEWARDVDARAFGPGTGRARLVTAPNSPHLAVWRERASKAPSADNASTQVA